MLTVHTAQSIAGRLALLLCRIGNSIPETVPQAADCRRMREKTVVVLRNSFWSAGCAFSWAALSGRQ